MESRVGASSRCDTSGHAAVIVHHRCAIVAWPAVIASAVLFAVALGAKESAATVPGIVALCAWGWRAPGDGAAPSARAVIARGWRAWSAYAIVLAIMIAARRVVLGGYSVSYT